MTMHVLNIARGLPRAVTLLVSVLCPTLSLALRPAVVSAQSSAQSPSTGTPTLIVFITVDQMRPDYLDRFGSQLTGGLARLTHGGAVFTNAFQDHAITVTAQGHASTMSGRFPRSTGIISDDLGTPDPQSPLIGGGGLVRSRVLRHSVFAAPH